MRSRINKDYHGIRTEYLSDAGVFSNDTLKQKVVKDFIRSKLSTSEQTVITLYAELGSLSKLSQILNISKSTIHIEVQRIQKKVKQWYISNYLRSR